MEGGPDQRSERPPTGVVPVPGWGWTLEVRNDESVDRLRRFVEDASPGERWAAVIPWMTRRDRRHWEQRLRAAGLTLRETDPREVIDQANAAAMDASPERRSDSRAIRFLSLPAFVAIRLSGRRTVVYETTLPPR